MPIEIFELVVKATVNDSLSDHSNGTTSASGSANNRTHPNENEIAEKVLEIMKRKKER